MQVRALATLALLIAPVLAGCLGGGDDGTLGGADSTPVFGVLTSNLDDRIPEGTPTREGTVKRDGVGYGAEEFSVEVPEGAAGVHAVATWDPKAPLRLSLASPTGEVVNGRLEHPGHARVVTLAPPEPGTWTVRVVSPSETAYAFSVRAWAVDEVTEGRVDEQIALREGQHLEVNLLLAANTTFQWAFESTSGVRYDVHSHDGPQLVTHASGTARQQAGQLTATADNVYSFYATGKDGEEVTFSYAVRGPFRVTSRLIGG